MYRPTLYRNGIFDDLFELSFPGRALDSLDKRERKGMMKTDIYEKDKTYELAVELPGFRKEDIEITLEKGSLTVSAANKEENSVEETNYIRRERFCGEVARTFYVGDELKEKDIHARFENGVLYLEVPKEVEKEEETKKLIAID